MDQFKLNHRPAPGFAAGIATGMGISGPSGDGMVHLTFFRDAYRMASESYSREYTSETRYALTPLANGTELDIFREDLAAISCSPKVLRDLYETLGRYLEMTSPSSSDSEG